MNWYKQSQNSDPISQQYTNILDHNPISVNITGSGVGQSISIPGTSKTISARDLLQKAVNKIKPILTQHNVNTIDTNPISRSDAQGLAVSSEPGKIHIDIGKIFNTIRSSLPPTVQTDGAQVDPDQLNSYVDQISGYILSELGETAAHESYHTNDFFQAFQTGKPFNSVQEMPAQQFGRRIRKEKFITPEFLL